MEKQYYTAVAKDDMYLDDHSWEKGQKYQMVVGNQLLTLASEEGQVHYVPEKMGDFEQIFDIASGWGN